MNKITNGTVICMKEDSVFYNSGDIGVIEDIMVNKIKTLHSSYRLVNIVTFENVTLNKLFKEYDVNFGLGEFNIACERDEFIVIGKL